jgi:hypothetical protein
MPNTLNQNPSLLSIEWRDLLQLTRYEKWIELSLPFPWLLSSLYFYHRADWIAGAFCSFYFFLTDVRRLPRLLRGFP